MEYKGKLYGKYDNNKYFEILETTEDIDKLRDKAKKYDELENMVSKEMGKSDEESDLVIIGEMIVGSFGYYG